MNEIVENLKCVLADSYAVFLKTQSYHWNVAEKFVFRALHLLFEGQYLEMVEGLDLIAERILQVGSKAPASFSAYAALTTIPEGNENNSAEEMIRDLIASQTLLIDRLNEGVKIANAAGDEGTADLLVDRLRVHEKNRWMLESNL